MKQKSDADAIDRARIARYAIPHELDRKSGSVATGRRVAFFGGSFNPPHVGHAAAIRYALGSGKFDEVWCVPAAQHAFGKALAPFAWRANWVARLLQDMDDTRVRLCLVEGENPENASYTIDTLSALQKIYPHHHFSLVVGSDAATELPHWHRIDELRCLVDFFKVPRSGYEDSSLPHVSGTGIRARIVRGEDVRDFVTPSVYDALTG